MSTSLAAQKNTNQTLLGKPLMATIYESVILRWELSLKDHKSFSIRTKEFATFRRNLNLELEPLKSSIEFKARSKASWPTNRNWMVFCEGDESQAKAILKHLRNAAAHGHLEKKGIALHFKSYNTKDKQVMQGQIECKNFANFINALLSTAVKKLPREVDA